MQRWVPLNIILLFVCHSYKWSEDRSFCCSQSCTISRVWLVQYTDFFFYSSWEWAHMRMYGGVDLALWSRLDLHLSYLCGVSWFQQTISPTDFLTFGQLCSDASLKCFTRSPYIDWTRLSCIQSLAPHFVLYLAQLVNGSVYLLTFLLCPVHWKKYNFVWLAYLHIANWLIADGLHYDKINSRRYEYFEICQLLPPGL